MSDLRKSRTELDNMVVNIELTLTSIIQGVALSFLVENTRQILLARQWHFLPYAAAGLVIILLFWSRSLVHTMTLIRWPLEFGHNFLYFLGAFIEALVFTRLTDPFMWFALNSVFGAVVWFLFIYDLRMIRARETDSAGPSGSQLYAEVNRDQRMNIRFIMPLIVVSNVAGALVVRFFPDFFLQQNGHLILIGLQIVGLIWYQAQVVRKFVRLSPTISATRVEWRDDPFPKS